jgi:hypothetical protein
MDFEEMIERMKKYQTTVRDLLNSLDEIPPEQGIYVIDVPEGFDVEFITETSAPKKHRGKNLIYATDKLKEKFNTGDEGVVYIGKAEGLKGLRNRLGAYIKYAYGADAPHRGGRGVWQIKNFGELTVYFFVTEKAGVIEKELLKSYKAKYGVYPVGNRRG